MRPLSLPLPQLPELTGGGSQYGCRGAWAFRVNLATAAPRFSFNFFVRGALLFSFFSF